jgi:hypothetical protein
MSNAVEYFHVFAKARKIRLESAISGNLLFCIGTPCGSCPVLPIRGSNACAITESELKELHETHPEHFI